VTQTGQLAIREFVQAYLKRVDRDPQGIPIRLYPFTRKRVERFKAGEPMGALADDYGRSLLEIEEAIRCELRSRRPSPPPVPRSS